VLFGGGIRAVAEVSGNEGGHAAGPGLVRQLLLEYPTRARSWASASVSAASFFCRAAVFGGALLGVEGACRALVGEAP
jgi:hypothetical protein